uniref:Uncharacterized protein n=1 Tax=Arundo donax TaxID=35708 RepID=A0A0A9C2F2_ARUDO
MRETMVPPGATHPLAPSLSASPTTPTAAPAPGTCMPHRSNSPAPSRSSAHAECGTRGGRARDDPGDCSRGFL